MQLLSQSTDTARDKTRNKLRRFDPIRSPIADCSRKPNLLESLKTRKEAVKKIGQPSERFLFVFFFYLVTKGAQLGTRQQLNELRGEDSIIIFTFI